MNRTLFLIFIITIILGCSNDDNDLSEVRIRVANISQFDFKNLVVTNTTYEDLTSKQNTDYKVFESAYRYAFIELEIEGKTHTLQPFDFVGETLLKNGNYTYQIDANDSLEQYGKLSLTLIED